MYSYADRVDAAGPLGDRRLHPRAAAVASTRASATCRRSVARSSRRAHAMSAASRRGGERVAWIAGVAGAAAARASPRMRDRATALQSYLFVWWFLLGLPLGSMAMLMVHNLTGGGWGELIRPALEAALRLLPLSLLLAAAAAVRLARAVRVGRAADVARRPAAAAQGVVSRRVDFFLLRSAVYFVVWLALAHLLRKWSFARAPDARCAEARRLRAISAIGLLRLRRHRHFRRGRLDHVADAAMVFDDVRLLVGIGQALCAFAFAIVCARRVRHARRTPTGERSPAMPVFQDLGNLLLMFVMTWAYLAFTQYLIIWAEDLPNEIAWYLPRVQTELALTSRWFLVVFHFALPFLVLLSRRAKRAPRALGVLGGCCCSRICVDAFWLVLPASRRRLCHRAGRDLLAVLGWAACCSLHAVARPQSFAAAAGAERRRSAMH